MSFEFPNAAGHVFIAYTDNPANCRRCGSHKGNHDYDPHPFVGRLDRDCEICARPDRALIHDRLAQVFPDQFRRFSEPMDTVTCRHCGAVNTSGVGDRWYCHTCGGTSTPQDRPWRPQDAPRREIPIQTPPDRSTVPQAPKYVLTVQVALEGAEPFEVEHLRLENRAVALLLFEHLQGQIKLAGFFKPVLDKAP